MTSIDATNEAALSVGYFTLAFLIYFFSPQYHVIKRAAIHMGDAESQPEKRIYLERLMGFILLGLIPGIFFQIISDNQLVKYGFALPFGKNLWLWWLIPLFIFIGINIFRPEKGVNTAFYPQVRKEEWDIRRLLVNTLSWVIYLIGYEFAFRGWLFFACLNAFGYLPAVMINCAFYGISHIYKGPGEAFGAFFSGILLCVIAANTGSFVIPLVLHLVLAVGNDLKAIAVNPKMTFSLKGKHSGESG
jgi:membrane protease YdiL (CAAX protease family)